MVGKLQNSTLTVSTGRDGNNIRSIGDSCNDTGSKNDLLPGLANVDNVNTVGTGLEDVGLVVNLIKLLAHEMNELAFTRKEDETYLDVLGSKVNVSRDEELSILRCKLEKI